jgi:hypothetical protein
MNFPHENRGIHDLKQHEFEFCPRSFPKAFKMSDTDILTDTAPNWLSAGSNGQMALLEEGIQTDSTQEQVNKLPMTTTQPQN